MTEDIKENIGPVVDESLLKTSPELYRKILRHSAAHVMAKAICQLFPGTLLAIGPDIENGFYYDVLIPGNRKISEADLPLIESKMREIIKAKQDFVRQFVSIEDAYKLFKDQKYKLEIIDSLASAQLDQDISSEVDLSTNQVSIYKTGDDFIDLCKGPHVKNTSYLNHFKLLRVSGAYWRGNEKNDQLQRVYGTVWETQDLLDSYLNQLQEAEKRDHRKLAKELDLFSFPSEVGAGLVLFHPKGALIRRIVEDFSYSEHLLNGYLPVLSPHLGKEILFETSGHLKWYKESMFPSMEVEGQRYYLKPMNCPFHILIYSSRLRSYKEMPLRLFEIGTVYRYERSGVLHGMSRLRGFTQDDSHIFLTEEQLEDELKSLVAFIIRILQTFGLTDFSAELSTRPEKFVGEIKDWEAAEAALENAARACNLKFSVAQGQGAFYAPKLDIHLKDAIGRLWQCSTIQVDFQEPVRFNLKYVSKDNEEKRPFMIHRALFGSFERFLAILTEHFAGNFPTWMAPVQVKILPVSSEHLEYAKEIYNKLTAHLIRAEISLPEEPLGSRVRTAKLEKIPYVLVVGKSDVKNQTVGVNVRLKNEVLRDVLFENFLEVLQREIKSRSLETMF